MTTKEFFSSEQRALLDQKTIPRHIAIIPDGNRRWARRQETSSQKGHENGADVLIQIVKAAKELGVKTLTFYVFSTENWNRPADEVAAFMWLIQEFLNDHCAEMQEDGVRLHTIGDLNGLPQEVLNTVEKTLKATEHCSLVNLVLAINYGGRDEIKRVFNKLLDEDRGGERTGSITEEMIANHLDTAPWGDPDLLIRTSGEMRLSNFLLWQLSYAEIYITDLLWPDFKPIHLLEAMIEFQQRERRLGGA